MKLQRLVKDWSYGVFALMLVGPYLWLNLSIGLVMLVSLARAKRATPVLEISPILTIALFTLLLLGMTWSSDITNGLSILSRLWVVPALALLSLFGLLQSRESIALKGLKIGTAFFAFICLCLAAFKTIQTGSFYDPLHETHFSYNNFIHQNLTSPLGLNAVYLAAAAGICLIDEVRGILKKLSEGLYPRLSDLPFPFFFLTLMALCKSAMVAVAVLIALSFLILLDPKLSKIWERFGRHLGIGLGLLGLLCVWVAYSKLEAFELTFDYSNIHLRPLQIRLAIWGSALSKISEHIWLGFGTGDAKAAIMEAYANNRFEIGAQNEFNAHNQFLDLWLQCGIVGPLIFSSILIIRLWSYLRSGNMVLASALIVFFMLSLSESTLLTFRGIAFFCFCVFFPTFRNE